jgi:hypothetical protein
MTPAPVPVVWRRREPPLEPRAVLARGARVNGLATATAARVSTGCDLRAAAGSGWLLVLGEADDLPWAEGVQYLGWDCGLLVPTTQVCSPSADLVRRALEPHLPPSSDLVVVADSEVLVAPMPSRPIHQQQLDDLL